MGTEPEATLDALRNGLMPPPDQIDTRTIAPLFVSATFFAKGWVGPFLRLRAANVALTWSILLSDQTMRYVDGRIAGYWDAKAMDWKGLARSNLIGHSNENPGTHEFRRSNGEVYAIAMMHEDGIGPSRLLLRERLSRIFPQGYRVALPEMSCGLAFAVNLESAEEQKLRDIIHHCYEKGTRPLAPGIYGPDDLLPITT